MIAYMILNLINRTYLINDTFGVDIFVVLFQTVEHDTLIDLNDDIDDQPWKET